MNYDSTPPLSIFLLMMKDSNATSNMNGLFDMHNEEWVQCTYNSDTQGEWAIYSHTLLFTSTMAKEEQ